MPGQYKENGANEPGKLPGKVYARELLKLQTKLVEMQEWVKSTGAKIVIVFEGRDAAGKGGVIHRIMERVSPRVFRHVALPAPTERDKSQMYVQRYMKEMPAAGEIVVFDRSWYNRALVEHVMGFCTEKQYDTFFETVLVSKLYLGIMASF
jgi:polyphosphate kinase 2 (PPK2 family)